MPTDYIQPFDFRKILVNYFLGSTELFLYAFIIVFSFFAAKFQFSNRIYLLLLTIGSLIFAGILGEAIYILIFVIIGFSSFKIIGRLMQ